MMGGPLRIRDSQLENVPNAVPASKKIPRGAAISGHIRWSRKTFPWVLPWVAMVIGLSGCGAMLNRLPDAGSEATSPPPPEPAMEAPPATAPPTATPTAEPTQPDTFREAINRASSAVAIGQSAQSADDWKLAVSRWQQAIALLQQVPTQSPNFDQAQAKIQEYQQHLTSAQQRASGKPIAPPAPALNRPPLPAGLVAQIPIRGRQGGIPVVSVSLRGQQGDQTFPMLFDTGATGTLITPAMAQAVGVQIEGEVQAQVADGSTVSLPIGVVEVLEVGGLQKQYVQVAIGGNVALLGQNVYGDYQIAIGSHMINLHP
jgi:predicted aspartyl protease